MDEYLELGLTKNEGKAYHVLLGHGVLSASEVSKYSHVPYGRIYDVLESLEQKGLVSVVPEKTKKFVASDPSVLTEKIDEREKKLLALRKKIDEMKHLYDASDRKPVVVGYGKRAFYKLLGEMDTSRKISYSIRWSSEYKPEWVEGMRKLVRKGGDWKTLARYDSETKKDVDDWRKKTKHIRTFDNDGVAMSILDNEVLISLITSNTTLLVRDSVFADVMKRLFAAAYDTAGKME